MARLASVFVLAIAPLLSGCATTMKVVELVVKDNDRDLRKRPDDAPRSSPTAPPILFLALDGVNRDLIYDQLRKGELPKLAELLSGQGKQFPHAYFDETLLSTMPSSTMAAWTTVLTGEPPAVHGVSGNEFFIREEHRLGAPAPVSFEDSKPTIEIYTDGYLNSLVKVPTIYQRLRAREPNLLIWVALHQLYSGADRLLFAKKTVMADAFQEGLYKVAKTVTAQGEHPDRGPFAALDRDVVELVDSDLSEDGPVPDVLTVYLSGTDLYAHVAEEGPDQARRAYLREVVDPALGKLLTKLRERHAFDDRWVVLTSDHGHTPVLHDEQHALWTEGDDTVPGIMKKSGYHPRPFKLDVDEGEAFDAVLTEGGATAYVYLADRSRCPPSKPCDWKQPPRYEDDVLPLAEALFRNNADGVLAPRMKGTLDIILTRRPKPWQEKDLPFEVYVGGGKTVPVAEYIKEHPHPTYVELEARLRDLAVGERGERAGDIMLLPHNGDREAIDYRYYFAALYRSWHGSPSRQDSEVPLIVAHAGFSSEQIRARVQAVLGVNPRQQKVSDVLFALRTSKR